MVIFICFAVLAGFAGFNNKKFYDSCEESKFKPKACKVFLKQGEK